MPRHCKLREASSRVLLHGVSGLWKGKSTFRSRLLTSDSRPTKRFDSSFCPKLQRVPETHWLNCQDALWLAQNTAGTLVPPLPCANALRDWMVAVSHQCMDLELELPRVFLHDRLPPLFFPHYWILYLHSTLFTLYQFASFLYMTLNTRPGSFVTRISLSQV
jgi:hypothetical protein